MSFLDYLPKLSHLAPSKRRSAAGSPDYRNGDTYSWSGGDCPVHPDDLLEATVLVEGDTEVHHVARGRFFDWKHDNDPVTQFRVIRQAENVKPAQ